MGIRYVKVWMVAEVKVKEVTRPAIWSQPEGEQVKRTLTRRVPMTFCTRAQNNRIAEKQGREMAAAEHKEKLVSVGGFLFKAVSWEFYKSQP